MNIVIVEDNVALSQGLAYLLEGHGHSVTLAADGEAGLRVLAGNDVDLLVLDLGLPKVHGSEVLRQVRARPAHLPVLLFSALDDANARLAQLGLEADAHLVKPFGLADFEAQIAGLERRFHPPASRSATFGPIRCNLAGGSIQVEGVRLDLPADERHVLWLLVQGAGEPVRSDELAAQLPSPNGWGGADPVAACVARLSGRLGPLPVRIVAVRGLGYMLVNS